ncbi:uncharacterized protein DSM5745_08557 [Aspergillus mulundensis]|uniref:Uncharacterized protein n=1 Tax=Aspergillus mulundensis TaxID=1810919 RepID=A0A3D8R480_9EURO|nr:hypothetical protein DSM5745_08557 [Aspergillus mulundensis]RDW68797.1 hypothetical protein DSM5745_08557 [Aspergillus mulundensis]
MARAAPGDIAQIWQGLMPALDPVVAATWVAPPNGTNPLALATYTRQQLLTFMRDPQYAVDMFTEGERPLRPVICWPNYPRMRDEAAVIWQYRAVDFPPGPGVPALPHTQPRIDANIQTLGVVDPIRRLIYRGDLHALDALKRADKWSPDGYGRDGMSYAAMAWNNGVHLNAGHELVLHYILYSCRKSRTWAQQPLYCPRLNSNAPSTDIHLDLILTHYYHLFWRYWSFLDRVTVLPGGHITWLEDNNGNPRLSPRSLATLADNITGGQYKSLMANNAFDLATHVPDIWYRAVNPNPNANLPQALWTSAVARAAIDTPPLTGPFLDPPLQHAFTLRNYSAFVRLLRVGACADTFLRSIDGIHGWHGRRSREWKYIAAAVHWHRNINPNPGGQVAGGTLYHVIVRMLDGRMIALALRVGLPGAYGITAAQEGVLRARLYAHARRFIQLVGGGSRFHVNGPNRTTRNDAGNTAADEVRALAAARPGIRLHSLIALL